MATDPNHVVVEDEHCSCCSVPTKVMHHRHFPELRVECGSLAEGAAHLSDRLAHHRGWVGDSWHRETIDSALADIASFRDATAGADRAEEPACRCAPHGEVRASRVPLESTFDR